MDATLSTLGKVAGEGTVKINISVHQNPPSPTDFLPRRQKYSCRDNFEPQFGHMASQNYHSGLEVAPEPKPYVSPRSTATQPYYPPETGAGHHEKTTCGVRRLTFWLMLALLFVILAAGIGGGVGGGSAVHNAKR